MNAQPMLDVLTVGEPMAEFSHGGSDTYCLGYGGDVLNVAVAVSRLGGQSGIACRLGNDYFGEKILRFLNDEKVNVASVQIDDGGYTGSYFIHHTENGHAFHYQRNKSAASHWGPSDAGALAIDHVSIVHFSGISQAISVSSNAGCDTLLAKAEAAGKTIAYDPNFRPQLWSLDTARDGLEKVLKYKPVLLPGLDDARQLTGLDDPEEIARTFIAKGASVVALTAGDHGVYVGDTSGVTRIPGIPAHCVDASGAGDCFDGAFLVRIAKGDSPVKAAQFGNIAAAMSVAKHGAAISVPTLAALRA